MDNDRFLTDHEGRTLWVAMKRISLAIKDQDVTENLVQVLDSLMPLLADPIDDKEREILAMAKEAIERWKR